MLYGLYNSGRAQPSFVSADFRKPERTSWSKFVGQELFRIQNTFDISAAFVTRSLVTSEELRRDGSKVTAVARVSSTMPANAITNFSIFGICAFVTAFSQFRSF